MAGYQGNLPICYPHCVCGEQLKQESYPHCACGEQLKQERSKIKIKKCVKVWKWNKPTNQTLLFMHGA